MLRVIGINLAVLAAVIVLVELAFGTWFSDVHALHQFTMPRDLRIERDNPLSDTPPSIVYSRDANGLRGLDGPVSDIDILTVGGSTTDQRFLDDSQTYQASLSQMFAQAGQSIAIANAGIDGQSTFGHIENFTSWFSKIDGLQARYITFLVGVNDALILNENNDYDSVQAQGRRLRLQLYIREKSALYQLYLIGKGAFLTPNITHTQSLDNFAVGSDLVRDPLLPASTFKQVETEAALLALTDRIETLADLSREMGAIPVFVTQRSTAWTRRDGEILGVVQIGAGFHSGLTARYGPMNGIDMYRIERAVADAIMAGCKATTSVCFDMMADLDFDLRSDFYDAVHTTAAGSAKIAAYLFGRFQALEGF